QHYYDRRYKDAGKPAVLKGECEGNPTLGFGKVYNDNLQVKLALGCQYSDEGRATVTRQTFEHGLMLGVLTKDSYSGNYKEEVHALYSNGEARSFEAFPVEVEGGVPPLSHLIGKFASTANFDSVWSQNAEVKSKLGNSTGPASI